jgi:hypothetical protein
VSTDAQKAYKLCKLFNRLLSSGMHELVGSMLDRVNPRLGSNVELVGTLRYTYAGRQYYRHSWRSARDRVAKELTRRGEDPLVLLRGLYREEEQSP